MSVAATYAEALFEAAEAQSAVDQVRTELGEFTEAMAPGSELREALTSPEIETTAKRAAIADLLEGAHPVTLGFVQVLVDRGRIAARKSGRLGLRHLPPFPFLPPLFLVLNLPWPPLPRSISSLSHVSLSHSSL